MTTTAREETYIQRQRPRAAQGDVSAFSNIAAAYRILGKRRLAFRWWKKGADLGDGDALLEVGYCYHHGIGVRGDLRSAERAYRAAVTSSDITEFAREEARYHLSVLLLCKRSHPARREALMLLRLAVADNDYPQARVLSDQLQAGLTAPICTCRRKLRRALAAAQCPRHGSRGGD